ncbi:hypothetical protein [Nautilia lithotrophica]
MNKYSAEKISEIIKIHRNTWNNWKKTKPKLVELVLKGLETENGGITINGNNNIVGHHNKIMINGNDICAEICEALEKLPEQKQKKFFYKIMAELYEEMEK